MADPVVVTVGRGHHQLSSVRRNVTVPGGMWKCCQRPQQRSGRQVPQADRQVAACRYQNPAIGVHAQRLRGLSMTV